MGKFHFYYKIYIIGPLKQYFVFLGISSTTRWKSSMIRWLRNPDLGHVQLDVFLCFSVLDKEGEEGGEIKEFARFVR